MGSSAGGDDDGGDGDDGDGDDGDDESFNREFSILIFKHVKEDLFAL